MAIIRNLNREKYTVIDNTALFDKGISLKARGMLITLLSLPDNWVFSENGLEKIFEKDKKTSIRAALKELEEKRYLVRKQLKDTNGKFGNSEWIISEKPILENPISEKPITEKQPQLNTNILNTKKEIYTINLKGGTTKTFASKEEMLKFQFEKVWEEYPRKKGKDVAQLHFFKWIKGKKDKNTGIIQKLTAQQMKDAVISYAEECKNKNTDEEYIQHGSRFFNTTILDYVDFEESNDE